MRVISLLRSAVAGPRQRPIGALAILTVIVGIVMMHSMSGSPVSHSHHAPHEAPVVAVHDVVAEPTTRQRATAPPAGGAEIMSAQTAVAGVPTTATAGEPGTGVCHDGCGGHDLATAMCLMILVAILALVAPARRLLWLVPPERSAPLLPVPVGAGALVAPSLHELCISRT